MPWSWRPASDHVVVEADPALAGGVCLFLPRASVLTWKDAEREIEWGGLLLIVAGLALGVVAFESGAARWLAWLLLGGIRDVPGLLQPFAISFLKHEDDKND